MVSTPAVTFNQNFKAVWMLLLVCMVLRTFSGILVGEIPALPSITLS